MQTGKESKKRNTSSICSLHRLSCLMHPVFVIETVESSFFIPFSTYVPQTQENSAPFSPYDCPMPPKETTKTKKWGQARRNRLADLTNRQLIDITNTTYPNIDQSRDFHFWHRDKKNFSRNFRKYSAAWDLEIEYSDARHNGGKMRRLILLIFMPMHIN